MDLSIMIVVLDYTFIKNKFYNGHVYMDYKSLHILCMYNILPSKRSLPLTFCCDFDISFTRITNYIYISMQSRGPNNLVIYHDVWSESVKNPVVSIVSNSNHEPLKTKITNYNFKQRNR